MDASVNHQVPAARQSNGVLARLQIFGSLLNWLAGFIQLTEGELADAGIYLGE
jgi:hypothetical protein